MFWKRKKKARELKPWERKLYPKVFRQLNLLQRKWAKWMDRRYNSLSIRKKKLVLFSFCLLWLLALGFLTTKAILLPAANQKWDSKIKIPKTEMTSPEQMLALPKSTLARIRSFKSTLDSLGKTESGKRTRDSLLRLRPGLSDSIAEIERLYQLSENKYDNGKSTRH